MKLSQVRIGTLQLASAMVLSGTIGVVVTESHQQAANVVLFRCLFGAIAIGAYCLVRGLFKNSGLTRRKFALALLGGACIVFNWVLFFKAFALTSITVTTVVYHIQPFFVVLLGLIVFRDRISADKLGWMVIAFIGIVCVTDPSTSLTGDHRMYFTGILFALTASLLYSVATIIAKYLKDVTPHVTVFIQITFGTILVLPFASLAGLHPTPLEWSYLVFLGVVLTGIMYILVYAAFHKLPTPMIAILTFIYPAVAVLSDMIVYGRRLDALQIAGIILIFGSNFASGRDVALVSRLRRRPA